MKVFGIGLVACGVLLMTGGQGEAQRLRSWQLNPWCEVSSADGIYHCDFKDFEQCRRYAVGDGVCENNPWYVGTPPQLERPRRKAPPRY
jgi:hypothetical protein